MEVKVKDLKEIYEKKIRIGVKNKRKIMKFEENKIQYILEAKRILETSLYDGGKYHIFLIYKPKIRVVMSQSIYDKLINHYVTQYILMPKLTKYLNDRNCATRENMGGDYAVKKFLKDLEYFKKYDEIYFLKLDIKKYFYKIDHEVLLNMLRIDLNDEEYDLLKKIIDSTDLPYVNKTIIHLEKKTGEELPLYETGKGLPIGNMTSQFLAIFYLSKLRHYMISNLKLKFINYMDDYIIVHHDKKYLEECLEIIKYKLETEYKLKINEKKTFIVNAKEGVNFLGYNIKVVNKKTIVKLSTTAKRNIKKGVKRLKYQFGEDLISYQSFFCGIENYKHSYPFASKASVKRIFNRYWL